MDLKQCVYLVKLKRIIILNIQQKISLINMKTPKSYIVERIKASSILLVFIIMSVLSSMYLK
jgi:hypothetical protein